MTTPPRQHWNPAATDEPSHLRRNVLMGMSTLSAVVLAMGYHTSLDAQSAAPAVTTVTASRAAAGAAAGGTGGGSATGSSSAGASTGATPSAGATPSTGSAGTSLTDGTYTGAVAATRWGNVQVRIVVSGGRITSSTAVKYPTENSKDVQINSRAVPSYNAAAVAAQSAQIDAISGATVTWQGYTSSLQSAIDQARA